MLISNIWGWGFWAVVIILAFTVAGYVNGDLEDKNDDTYTFGDKFIKRMRTVAAFAIFGLICFGFFSLNEKYTSSYIMITDIEGEIGAEGFSLWGESTYEWADGTTIPLIQSTNGWLASTYLNDSTLDVVIHPVAYGVPDSPVSDVIIPSMQAYVDVENLITINYTVQSKSAIKESDETGIKFYLRPVDS